MEKKTLKNERTMSWEMYFNQQWTQQGKTEKMLSAYQNIVEYHKTMQLVRGTMLSLGIDIANGFIGKGDISNKAICRAFTGIAREMGLGDVKFASYHANFFRTRIASARQHGKVVVRGNASVVKAVLEVIGIAYRKEPLKLSVRSISPSHFNGTHK